MAHYCGRRTVSAVVAQRRGHYVDARNEPARDLLAQLGAQRNEQTVPRLADAAALTETLGGQKALAWHGAL